MVVRAVATLEDVERLVGSRVTFKYNGTTGMGTVVRSGGHINSHGGMVTEQPSDGVLSDQSKTFGFICQNGEGMRAHYFSPLCVTVDEKIIEVKRGVFLDGSTVYTPYTSEILAGNLKTLEAALCLD